MPKYGTDILEFHKRIDKYHIRKDDKPMLVHCRWVILCHGVWLVCYLLLVYVCSAGVGRTGTFIAIDVEIQRIGNESLVDVHNSVCRLRFYRNFMVQTVVRYDPFTRIAIYGVMFNIGLCMLKFFIMFTVVIRFIYGDIKVSFPINHNGFSYNEFSHWSVCTVK